MPFCHIIFLFVSDAPAYRSARRRRRQTLRALTQRIYTQREEHFLRPSLPHPFAIFLLLGDGFSGGAAARASKTSQERMETLNGQIHGCGGACCKWLRHPQHYVIFTTASLALILAINHFLMLVRLHAPVSLFWQFLPIQLKVCLGCAQLQMLSNSLTGSKAFIRSIRSAFSQVYFYIRASDDSRVKRF